MVTTTANINMMNKKKRGLLTVICGSMFSGKTELLIKFLTRAEYAKKRVLTVKHAIDQRDQQQIGAIMSHEGNQRVALVVGGTIDSLNMIIKHAQDTIDIIGIDEIQFFPEHIITVLGALIEDGKDVFVAGLDLDFRGEPFGIVPALMALADEVIKLKAVCVICGHDAQHTQRLVNGNPALYDDPLIVVGASELYEARCRNCFAIDKAKIFYSKVLLNNNQPHAK